MVDSLSYFSLEPVVHELCNKDRGMWYLWYIAYKKPLAANRKE